MKQAQNAKHEGSATKKTQKRVMARKRRRSEKRDPENAMTKPVFKNYTD